MVRFLDPEIVEKVDKSFMDMSAYPLRGSLRLGMVTTCLPKARDGHHMFGSTSNQVT